MSVHEHSGYRIIMTPKQGYYCTLDKEWSYITTCTRQNKRPMGIDTHLKLVPFHEPNFTLAKVQFDVTNEFFILYKVTYWWSIHLECVFSSHKLLQVI